MTDIVKRLRSLLTAAILPERRAIVEEAAAEIERLTAREEQRAERLRLYMNRIGELEADNERLQAAIRWALGETGEFTPPEGNTRRYWWRTELRRRALENKP